MTATGPAPGHTRVRLDLRYDGTDFRGWASQPDQRSVEAELSAGLSRITGLEQVRITVAGRTDAGVHARGQVAHVDLPAPIWAGLPRRSAETPQLSLIRRLAGVLPPDVAVIDARAAPAGFDARWSALWRRYRYRVADHWHSRDPIRRRDVLWTRNPLDAAAMDEAMGAVLGEHDFLAFCRPRPGASTIRTVLELCWQRDDAGLAVMTVRADAFCHHMVRSLVGVSLAVGQGRRPVGWPADLLGRGQRDPAVSVVDPRGLTLEQVGYPDDPGLAEQARRARRFRGANDPGPPAPRNP